MRHSQQVSQHPGVSVVDRPRVLASDQAFWWLIDQSHPVHVAVVAEITGPTTIDGWRKAIDQMQRRHPNLCGRITEDENAKLWFQHVADASIPLRVVEGDATAWEPVLAKEMATRLDRDHAPLARATLIHQPDRSTFVLAMHHAIADAKSIVFAIRDVLLVLSGQPLEQLPPIPSLAGLLFRAPIDHDADAIDTLPPVSEHLDIFRSFEGETPIIVRRTLARALTSALRIRCRAEETTVHGALVAAAVKAARQLSDELRQAQLTVISPSDMRRLLGAGDDVAPLAGGATMIMKPDTMPPDFWQAARLVSKGLVPPRTLQELSQSFAPIDRFMSERPGLDKTMAFLAARGGPKISVNNLGALPIPDRFGQLTLEAVWGPCMLMGYEGERLISAATVNGSLHLMHTSYTPLPSVLEVMEQLLAGACSSQEAATG